MRRALLAAGLGVLACCCTAPLAAQADGTTPDPAAPGDAAPPAPGTIHLVSASETVWARGVVVTDPDAMVCLEEGEEVLLASDRVTFTLSGARCFTPEWGERRAFEHEQQVIAAEAAELARIQLDEARQSGDAAAIAQAEQVYAAAHNGPGDPVVEAEVVESTGAASPAPRSARPKRARTGSVRPSASRPAPAPPRPVIFRLANASPEVLKRYPRGTLVQRTTALCLNHGEEATIVGSNGQSVSYSGPGCLHRKARPTAENIGGFTFG